MSIPTLDTECQTGRQWAPFFTAFGRYDPAGDQTHNPRVAELALYHWTTQLVGSWK